MAPEDLSSSTPQSRLKLLEYWRLVGLLTGHVHMWYAAQCSRRKNWLTVTNIVATILVFLFSTSEDIKTLVNVLMPGLNVSLFNKTAQASGIIVSFAAAMVVISTMLQFYLRYEERHLEHKNAALEYFNLANKILRYMDKGACEEDLHKLNTHMNFLNRGSPGHFRYPIPTTIRSMIWQHVREWFGLPRDRSAIDIASKAVTDLEGQFRQSGRAEASSTFAGLEMSALAGTPTALQE